MTKISNLRLSMAFLALALVWWSAVWIVTGNYYRLQTSEQVRKETRLSAELAQDLANSILRNLNYVSGVPGFFNHAVRVRHAVSRFGAGVRPSRLSIDARRRRWTADPILKDLDQTLAIASASFNVDMIYVDNAAGDAIASSNWDKPTSTVGLNFADREYFHLNKSGQRAEQYAVGKATHIPGLYFSSPIFIDGKFMGAVVAKVDVANLTFLIKQTDSFVADKNGVVILAYDRGKEMHSLAGSAIQTMSTEDRMALYLRDDFPPIRISSWENSVYPSVSRIDGKDLPQVIAVKEIPEYGLTVYVERDFPAYLDFGRDRMRVFLFASTTGTLLILLALGGLMHVRSINLAREHLHTSEKRFRTFASGTFEGISVTSGGKFLDVNVQLTRILGYKRNEIIGRPIANFIAPEDRERVLADFQSGSESNIEHEMLRKDGTRVLVETHGQTIEEGGLPVRLTAVRDITDRKRFELELERQAHIDYLTGVSNRGHFMDQAELELSRAVRYGHELSLFMLDIDFFKKINDSYGHKTGDLVLINLAKVCRETLRDVDIIGRVGGEEFVVLLPETSQAEAINVAERLRENISASKVAMEQGLPLHYAVSIGVTTLSSREDNLDVLLNFADLALYEAKEKGRNRVCVYK